MKLRSLLLSFAILAVLQVNGQSQSAMIQQAKAAGATDAQIQQAIDSQSTTTAPAAGGDEVKDVADEGDRSIDEDVESVDKQRGENAAGWGPDTIFGHEIFSTNNLTFAPRLNIPTPKDYIFSTGDEVRIKIWGNSTLDVSQKISPEGRIFIEDLGPIHLNGLTVDRAEAKVKSELEKIFKGLSDGTSSMSLTLGNIRSIKVNVVGEAYAPGTYTISSLATLFNVLYAAGGVNGMGSLRSIKLFRDNKVVADLDVYDYILNGNSKSDVRLEDGDMILISPIKILVSTEGELRRTRRYELKEGETLADLIEMAGGFSSKAYSASVDIDRKMDSIYKIRRVNSGDFASEELMNGDKITVKEIVQRYDNRVDISGAVWYPGVYELGSEVSTVKQLVEAASGLKGDEFTGRARLTRVNPDMTQSIIALDIVKIMSGEAADVELLNSDVLYIPSHFDLREPYNIKISGAVNGAGTFDFKDNITVEDAVIMAGGLRESAAVVNVDISRRVKNPMQTDMPSKIVDVFTVQLIDGLALSKEGDPIILEPFDEIYVRYSPGYREQEVVSVGGEVIFKGDYVLKSVNSRISDIIKDAGGLSPESYVQGANLTRRMTDDERTRVKSLNMIVNNKDQRDSLARNLADAEERYSVGIDLEKALKKPGSEADIVLRDGDVLFIPKLQSTVKISGSVVYPNSVTYFKGMKAKECVAQAGGYSDYAKKRRPIVIYMNGQVGTTKNRWIFFKKYPAIEPGCEVLVPTKRERDRMSAADITDIATSATYMAAITASLIK